MAENSSRSEIHCKKALGLPMPEHMRRANRRRPKGRAAVEHIFVDQKSRSLFIRTVGLARARTKIGLANLAYNIRRLIFPERQAAHVTA